MLDEVFILALCIALAILYAWAFRNLPEEKWQIMGCIPYAKTDDGRWIGFNLTWYGFFNALAIVVSVSIFLILALSSGQSIIMTLLVAAAVLMICLPASPLVARFVEGKKSTRTVGGASFVGIIILPWLVILFGYMTGGMANASLEVMPLMASVSIAYAFGEGIGRLACVSFGCCYGKKLSDCPVWMQRLFEKNCFVFKGKTKKIAYAHQQDGEKVVPIQAVTTVLLSATGIAGLYLYLKGFTILSFLLTLSVSQSWRVISEYLRADYRGGGSISAYQIMAGLALIYGWFIASFFAGGKMPQSDLAAGLTGLWDPGVVLFLTVLFAASFIYTGKSSVTSCFVQIDVVREKI